MAELIEKLFTSASGEHTSLPMPAELKPFQQSFQTHLQKYNLHHPSNVANIAYIFLGSLLTLPYTNVIDRLDVEKIYYKFQNDVLLLTVQFRLGPLEFRPKVKNFIINLNPLKHEKTKYEFHEIKGLYGEMKKHCKHLDKDMFARMFADYYVILLHRPKLSDNGASAMTRKGIVLETNENAPFKVVTTKFTLSRLVQMAEEIEPGTGFTALSSSFDKSLEKCLQTLNEKAPASPEAVFDILKKGEKADSLFSMLLNLYQHATKKHSRLRSEPYFISFVLGALSMNFESKYGLTIITGSDTDWNELSFLSQPDKNQWISDMVPVKCRFLVLDKLRWRKYIMGERFGPLQNEVVALPFGLTTTSKKVITVNLNYIDFMTTLPLVHLMENRKSMLPDGNSAVFTWPNDASKTKFIDSFLAIGFNMLENSDYMRETLKNKMSLEIQELRSLFSSNFALDNTGEAFFGDFLFGQLLMPLKYVNHYKEPEEYEKYIYHIKNLNNYGTFAFFVVRKKGEGRGLLFSIVEKSQLKFGSDELFRKITLPDAKSKGIRQLLCIDINIQEPTSFSAENIKAEIVNFVPFSDQSQHFLSPLISIPVDSMFKLAENAAPYSNSLDIIDNFSKFMLYTVKRYGKTISSDIGFQAFMCGVLMANDGNTFFPYPHDKSIIAVQRPEKVFLFSTKYLVGGQTYEGRVIETLNKIMIKMQGLYTNDYVSYPGRRKAVLSGIVYHTSIQGDTVHVSKQDTQRESHAKYEACLGASGGVGRRKRDHSTCRSKSFNEEIVSEASENVKNEMLESVRQNEPSKTIVSQFDEITQVLQSINSHNTPKIKTESLLYYRSLKHLHKLGRYSMFMMHAKISKDIIADFINGDYQDVAINTAMFVWSLGSGKLSGLTANKAVKLLAEEKVLLGSMLKAASPFIARGTSLFILSDLVSQIHRLNSGNKDAWVGIGADAACLTLDVAEIGIEISEAFGFIEGVAAVTGPLGFALTTTVFIGIDIYYAVKAIEKLDSIVELTEYEKFANSLLSFLHLRPQQYVNHMVEEKQLNDLLIEKGMPILNNFSAFFTPQLEKYCDLCPLPPCIVVAPVYACIPIKQDRPCKCHIKQIEDNFVNLLEKEKRYSRTWPETNDDDIDIFCSNSASDPESLYPHNSLTNLIDWVKTNLLRIEISHEDIARHVYKCENALGIGKKSTDKNDDIVLIETGNGNDTVTGFAAYSNVISIGDGNKVIKGGQKDDTFILHGNFTYGIIYGYSGNDVLNFASYATTHKLSLLHKSQENKSFTYLKVTEGNSVSKTLYAYNVNKFIGRKNVPDKFASTSGCQIEYVSLGGGKNWQNRDIILIANDHCHYNMQIDLYGYTYINNEATVGEFIYNVAQDVGTTTVYVKNSTYLKNTFCFNYSIHDVQFASIKKQRVGEQSFYLKFATSNESYLQLLIFNHSKNCHYIFKDGSQVIADGDSLVVTQNTTLNVYDAIEHYKVIANKLGAVIVAYSTTSNASIVVGHGEVSGNKSLDANLIMNDPYHHSHLVGGHTENMFVVSGYTRNNVTIYHYPGSKFNNILDLSLLKGQISNLYNATLSLFITQGCGKDLVIEIYADSMNNSSIISAITLHDGLVNETYKHLLVNLKQLLRISKQDSKFLFEPNPLTINESKSFIFISDSDIEPNTEIFIQRTLGDYKLLSLVNSLILTNVYYNNSDLENANQTSVLLHDFFIQPDMQTLKFHFKDRFVNFKEMPTLDHSTESTFLQEVQRFKSQLSNETTYNSSEILDYFD